VILRAPISQVRGHIDEGRPEQFLKIIYKDDKKIRMLKNTLNKYMADIRTRSTYDLSVRTEVGRKSTTKCISYTRFTSINTTKDYIHLKERFGRGDIRKKDT
jgi:hypothetical protein